MSGRKNADPLAGLDSRQITRELNEILAKAAPEAERILAELGPPERETRQQMNARHAAAGRQLQRVGLEFFRKRATTRRGGTCA